MKMENLGKVGLPALAALAVAGCFNRPAVTTPQDLLEPSSGAVRATLLKAQNPGLEGRINTDLETSFRAEMPLSELEITPVASLVRVMDGQHAFTHADYFSLTWKSPQGKTEILLAVMGQHYEVQKAFQRVAEAAGDRRGSTERLNGQLVPVRSEVTVNFDLTAKTAEIHQWGDPASGPADILEWRPGARDRFAGPGVTPAMRSAGVFLRGQGAGVVHRVVGVDTSEKTSPSE